MDENLTKEIVAFRDNRDWAQFHSPKNLALSIMIEAAELGEIFQWCGNNPPITDELRGRVSDELADILIYLTTLAHDLQIDTDLAIRAKLAINAERYPAAMVRGRSDKYTEYDR